MRFILVIERKHLFPGLSPQGFLPPAALDLDALAAHLFFAERDFMEDNSHYKQVIPYLMLQRGRGDDARLLVYQRRAAHSERRLGGLWSAGFGGHVEPIDRTDERVRVAGLVRAAALRELEEETGLVRDAGQAERSGFLNSDREEVSSVHLGVVYRVRLDDLAEDDETLCRRVCEQVEPHRALWLPRGRLATMTGPGEAPDGGTFEDWTRLALAGIG